MISSPKRLGQLGVLLSKRGYDRFRADLPFGELFSHFWPWPGPWPWPGLGLGLQGLALALALALAFALPLALAFARTKTARTKQPEHFFLLAWRSQGLVPNS